MTWYRPMAARSGSSHRAATPLELLFDLCFVVAVAQVSAKLHHALAEDHIVQGLLGFATVFFAIFWAWLNFTWFASAYDTDDVPYRLVTLVQIAGVLILAAGVPRAFDQRDFGVIVIGYSVMRLALAAQWLRAAVSDAARRRTAIRYAVGITVCQFGWMALLLVRPELGFLGGFAVLVACEMLVPVWAERASATTWHPEHIAERYSLFTIIVLGETILSATVAIQAGLDVGGRLGELVVIAASGLVVVFGMWWVYFDRPAHERLGQTDRTSFLWGYGHYVVFASAAAVGAGLAVAADSATHAAHLSERGAAFAVAIPVAVYLCSVWLLQVRPRNRVVYLAASVLALLTPLSPIALPLLALVVAALVTAVVVNGEKRGDLE
ncbi:low temperature requirement protein LtrA [Allocatelliglobosispora scoriae]|uniref:Low temperature requirement protein LtrA n=1 Tax=Allocatelliglobosispora scoriae TaxID=643052 RepID=A0A841BQR6_9ACTN|nr:low temperature requirement protein A [Allocatelliglobosispora scoriae]MBB5869273.1 low temperature requirement protein LtrA [Allocatelliglobosispora scoriae]